jgi:hypothetical protein
LTRCPFWFCFSFSLHDTNSHYADGGKSNGWFRELIGEKEKEGGKNNPMKPNTPSLPFTLYLLRFATLVSMNRRLKSEWIFWGSFAQVCPSSWLWRQFLRVYSKLHSRWGTRLLWHKGSCGLQASGLGN